MYRNKSYYPFYNDDSDYNVNAPSYYDDLARKQELIKKLSLKIWEYDEILAVKLKEVDDTLTQYGNILDGKIEDLDGIILDTTQKWLDENMGGIMKDAIQMVFFGLEGDYFIAYIPDTWDEIQFDTSENGELILTY